MMTEEEKQKFFDNLRRFIAEHGWEQLGKVLQETDFMLSMVEKQVLTFIHPDGSQAKISTIVYSLDEQIAQQYREEEILATWDAATGVEVQWLWERLAGLTGYVNVVASPNEVSLVRANERLDRPRAREILKEVTRH
jgi:hypothetical protein